MTSAVSATNALPCESTTFDLESPSATCNHKGNLSPTASVISTAPNTPSAEDNIKDKAMPKLPANIQTSGFDFDDSDDEEGLPGYPAWGSNWTMRALKTPDSKPAQSPMGSFMTPSFHLDDDHQQ